VSDEDLTRAAVQPTNWDGYGLREIWHMVNENIDNRNWEQIHSWNLMASLCQHHADQLRNAATTLAQHWSPAKSPAAAEFVDFVLKSVDSMEEAATAARSNAGALEKIMTSLVGALSSVRAIKERRDHFTRTARFPTSGHQFDTEARDVMRQIDSAISDARAELSLPPVALSIRMPTQRLGQLPGIDGPVWSGGTPEVPLPAATPPPPPLAVVEPHEGGAPVLGGGPVARPGMHGPSPALLGGRLPDSSVVVQSGAPLLPGGVIGWYPIGTAHPSRTTQQSGTAATGRGRSSGTPGRGQAAGARSTTPQGSTGAMPMMPMAPPVGRTGSGAPPGRSVGVGGHSVVGAAGGKRREVAPDDPWAVREGGPAVLQPAPESAQHDPGPGVIGIDR